MKAASLAFGVEIALLIEQHNGSFASWGRTVTYNRLVGGSVAPKPSRHIEWDAVDATFLNLSDRERYFAECVKRGYHGKKYPKGTRKGVPVYPCHIQRVPPRRRTR